MSYYVLIFTQSFLLTTLNYRAMFEFTFKGVNISVPSTGGPECANYLPLKRRAWETVLGITFAGLLIWSGWKNLYPVLKPSSSQRRDRFGRNILLVAMCLVIGCEVGFKLQAQSTIFLLNPCHVTTAIQVPFAFLSKYFWQKWAWTA